MGNSPQTDESSALTPKDDPGIIPYKTQCCTKVWRKFGLPCSPFEYLEFESRIVAETTAWQENYSFYGHFEHYAIQTGRHGAVCIRRTDGLQTNTGVLAELLIRRPDGRKKQWFIQIRSHYWNPNEDGAVTGSISTSQHRWSAATALDAIAQFAKRFGTYNPIKNNCRHFVEGLSKSMITAGPSRDVPATCNYWELGNYLDTNHKITFNVLPTDLLLIANQEDLDADTEPEVPVEKVTEV